MGVSRDAFYSGVNYYETGRLNRKTDWLEETPEGPAPLPFVTRFEEFIFQNFNKFWNFNLQL